MQVTRSTIKALMGLNLGKIPSLALEFMQVTGTTIKSRMGSKFGKIGPGSYELAALERLEKSP